MPQDARITPHHQPLHISASTIKSVQNLHLHAVSTWLAFESEKITRIVKYRFTFYTVLLKQQMLHAREFCKCSLKNINVYESSGYVRKTGCISSIIVPARLINRRARRLIRC